MAHCGTAPACLQALLACTLLSTPNLCTCVPAIEHLVPVPPCSCSCCRSYPALPEGTKPLDAFVAATNQLGAALDEEQQEALMGVSCTRSRLGGGAGVGLGRSGRHLAARRRVGLCQAASASALPRTCCTSSAPPAALPAPQELAKAMTKGSLLLVPLARER